MKKLIILLLAMTASACAYPQSGGFPSNPKFQSVTVAKVPVYGTIRELSSTDTTITNSTTLVNLASITIPAGVANAWRVEVKFHFLGSSSGAGGMQGGLEWSGYPTTPNADFYSYGFINCGNVVAVDRLIALFWPANMQAICATVGNSSAPGTADYSIILRTSAGGVLTLKAAQNTANANSLTIKSGAVITATPLP